MWVVKKSKIHGTGIFAGRDIKKGERVIRYIGDKILKSEGDRRSALRIKNFLNSEKTGSVYIFELNKKYDIDGNVKRNKARYINHSCDPNCEVEIENNEIWISSIRKIKKGSELSYDYGYEFDKDDYKDHICKCGSKNCIGYIISSDDWEKFAKHLNKIIKNKK
jgi:SET domain-containing protein|tara:strand:+ start:317 stop:808 length:492 start_codon:yes stop_codon:yes gene_type:complete